MMMMMHAPPSAVRMEGWGAATCGFANLIGGQFRVSGKVRGVAGGLLQGAWCPLAPPRSSSSLLERPRELAPPSPKPASPWHARACMPAPSSSIMPGFCGRDNGHKAYARCQSDFNGYIFELSQFPPWVTTTIAKAMGHRSFFTVK